ncbi:restriction endonuclease subunit S [Gemmatimonas sp.]|uniref:restriction endonuclease subunit S n=1 Tax=Gemmatimonas sp. TaxID=1962908 RepID=UPI0033415EBC
MLDAKRNVGASPLPYLRNVDVQWDRINTIDLPLIDIAPDVSERYTVRPGDLLVCEGGEVGRAAVWRGELDVCAFQKALHRLRPLSKHDEPNFLRYVLRCVAAMGVFEANGNPNTIPHLTGEAFRLYRFPKPPLAEQRRIASFLDREISKIDDLVAEQERLIALLKLKRQAVISHSVTKGLNPDAPMQDSGVEWIGQVPRNWSVVPLRSVAQLESGHTPSRQRPEWWVDCTIPWFSLADVWQIREGKADVVFETAEKVSELGIANSSARLLPTGTVILSRTASVGFSAIMGIPMATTQDFAITWATV